MRLPHAFSEGEVSEMSSNDLVAQIETNSYHHGVSATDGNDQAANIFDLNTKRIGAQLRRRLNAGAEAIRDNKELEQVVK